MRHKKLKLSAVVLLVLGLTGLKAQEAIPATSGNASGSGGTVSYSVGQVVYSTNTGTNGSVAEGVQQPFEISVVTGFEDIKGTDLSISAYPNPTINNITLRIDKNELSILSYQLYDINGKLLQNEKITVKETTIDIFKNEPSTYFVKVVELDKTLKIFKIIKN